ncbi:metallophosphoesterase [Adhaeribacter radiodurans]|uniref:Metallophosphoesterase n=1 Tax=Adhaeribacter radiodurans TaxID=2745197 RepID=A0A7L7LAL8_9BACT|nr:metallophosphoesterase [Adhaeribacter radiodurans]QMU29876.1 metallophosphoesterase [Adhaeribacter radiodurans]
MKNFISIPSDYLPQYDELYVISDLHLGGTTGFQIFNAGKELAKFILFLREKDPEKKIALLINGDVVDFLAEKPASTFDPQGALDKLDRIRNDSSFVMIWDALQSLVATPNRYLIINLGNHDLELALPWVRAHFLQILSQGNEAAQGRITLSFEGAGYICRVGKAQVLCVHGNEVDEWNVADYETIRRIGRDITQGRPVESWIPNAGTQLVIQIMNNLKSKFPFIDLLKPEAQAVLPTLLALDPEQQDKLSAIAATARRLLWDKIKIATGFLGPAAKEAAKELTLLDTDQLAIYPSDAYYLTGKTNNAIDHQQYAAELMNLTEERLRNNVHPVALIEQDLRNQILGFSSAIIKLIRGENRSEVLREALEKLQEDRTFDLKSEDETFHRLDEQMGDNFDFIIAGHTHLERALPRQKKKGWYYNSGTWVQLIQLKKEVLQNQTAFEQVFNSLKAGTMEALKPYVNQRLTVVVITSEGQTTKGQLQHVELNTSGELVFSNIPESKSS